MLSAELARVESSLRKVEALLHSTGGRGTATSVRPLPLDAWPADTGAASPGGSSAGSGEDMPEVDLAWAGRTAGERSGLSASTPPRRTWSPAPAWRHSEPPLPAWYDDQQTSQTHRRASQPEVQPFALSSPRQYAGRRSRDAVSAQVESERRQQLTFAPETNSRRRHTPERRVRQGRVQSDHTPPEPAPVVANSFARLCSHTPCPCALAVHHVYRATARRCADRTPPARRC
jgi:hypothetical protein